MWFLLCCALQMRLHGTGAYSSIPALLKNGPVLSRVKFNLGGIDGGFNRKNRHDRQCPVDFDTVRKLFKDTDAPSLRRWYNRDIAKFLRHNRAFDKHGIFVLDQTHVVVPENDNYKDAVRMPVDEHGQLIKMDHLTPEQRKAVKYHPCYALSELLHVGKDDRCYVVAGYQWGPGNVDELVQGRCLVKDFVDAVGKDVMKLLIDDRGYIDGPFITMAHKELKADVVLPLRKDMDMYQAAVRTVTSPHWDGHWTPYRTYIENGIRYTEEVACVENTGLWDECEVKLHLSIMRTNASDGSVSYWVPASTFKPREPKEAFDCYAWRVTIEERHRQFKHFRHIGAFTSPHESLVEAQVLFTLLTYTLVQLHLVKSHLVDLTNRTIDTLKQEERVGANAVIVYYGRHFAVVDLDYFTHVIASMAPQAREKLIKWLDRKKKNSGS